jgi:two-component system NarL family sensor kinase
MCTSAGTESAFILRITCPRCAFTVISLIPSSPPTLHDHVSQRLGILAISIDQLRMSPSVSPPIAAELDDLREQTSAIADDIRALSHRLHASMLEHLGVAPALRRLADECAASYALPITFTHTPLPARPSSDVALCLFRIAQDYLANCRET